MSSRRAHLPSDSPSAAGSEGSPDARLRLLQAGVEVFGHYGYDGATTRQLCRAAGVNQAAIPYYFGGKEEFYLAVVRHIVGQVAALLLPAVAATRRALADPGLEREELVELLTNQIAALGRPLARPQAPAWALILVREQILPTKAFAIIYEEMIRHLQEVSAEILGRLLRRPADDPEIIIRVQSLVGQVLIFLMGRATINRRLGVAELAPAQHEAIARIVAQHTRVILENLPPAQAGGKEA